MEIQINKLRLGRVAKFLTQQLITADIHHTIVVNKCIFLSYFFHSLTPKFPAACYSGAALKSDAAINRRNDYPFVNYNIKPQKKLAHM